MRNHGSGQSQCCAQNFHVVGVDDWDRGRAELLDVDAEETCHGVAELHAVEAADHCHGGADLHAVETEKQCPGQVLHQWYDELSLDIG